MNLKDEFIENMKKQDFFFWKKDIESSTKSKELWDEIYKIEQDIKELQRKRAILGTSAVIVGNNILREEYEKSL